MGDFEASEIRSFRLFAELAEDRFQGLIRSAVSGRFGARAFVIKEGRDPEFLHVLLEGSVELFAQADEQETTITILTPVTTFLLPAVVADVPYLASARALTSVRCLMIRADAVRDALTSDPPFARAVVCELSHGFRRLVTELKNQKLRTSTERLADWLLRANVQLGDTGRFTLPFEKRTLASRLGMTPENLSRNFKLLSGWGVTVRGRDVVLKNPRQLTALARDLGQDSADDPEF
jgi:CRP/FNR family transcriptional regulator, transcriptional activator FtrB